MKKFTMLLMALLLGVGGVSAKTSTTTLWEGSSVDGAEISLGSSLFTSAVSGDVLRVTFSFTSAGSMKLCYKVGESDGWNEHEFDGINKSPYFSDTNVKSADFTINSTDLSTLQTYGMYVYGFTSSTITKIELLHTLTPSSIGENLLSGNWEVAAGVWENKNFAAQPSAKIGDVILFDITVPSEYKYSEVQVKDSEGNDFENNSSYLGNFENETSETFEYEITNAKDLEKIQSAGFRINASNSATIKSIKLLSYDDSYDAVSITVGSEGIATYSDGNKNVQISACDALKAYYASAVTTGTVTLTELTGCIPANTGVMVFGEAGTYTVPVGDEGWPNITTNYLKPTGDYSADVAASTSGTFHYIFAKKNEGSDKPGFYKLTDAAHTLAAHKAYLETPTDITPANARVALVFSDEAETTGISASLGEKAEKTSEHIYNLRGMRVTQPQKGLYIKNGKKMIIR